MSVIAPAPYPLCALLGGAAFAAGLMALAVGLLKIRDSLRSPLR
jgi:hypothetical protein